MSVFKEYLLNLKTKQIKEESNLIDDNAEFEEYWNYYVSGLRQRDNEDLEEFAKRIAENTWFKAKGW